MPATVPFNRDAVREVLLGHQPEAADPAAYARSLDSLTDQELYQAYRAVLRSDTAARRAENRQEKYDRRAGRGGRAGMSGYSGRRGTGTRATLGRGNRTGMYGLRGERHDAGLLSDLQRQFRGVGGTARGSMRLGMLSGAAMTLASAAMNRYAKSRSDKARAAMEDEVATLVRQSGQQRRANTARFREALAAAGTGPEHLYPVRDPDGFDAVVPASVVLRALEDAPTDEQDQLLGDLDDHVRGGGDPGHWLARCAGDLSTSGQADAVAEVLEREQAAREREEREQQARREADRQVRRERQQRYLDTAGDPSPGDKETPAYSGYTPDGPTREFASCIPAPAPVPPAPPVRPVPPAPPAAAVGEDHPAGEHTPVHGPAPKEEPHPAGEHHPVSVPAWDFPPPEFLAPRFDMHSAETPEPSRPAPEPPVKLPTPQRSPAGVYTDEAGQVFTAHGPHAPKGRTWDPQRKAMVLRRPSGALRPATPDEVAQAGRSSGRCMMCGRVLTGDSAERGIGPECARAVSPAGRARP